MTVRYKGKVMPVKEAIEEIQGRQHINPEAQLVLNRIKDNGHATIGELFINGDFECYTLEDTFRREKIKHETRIPSGIYEIKLRDFGGHHFRYRRHRNEKIRENHKGMLWLQDVSEFTDILIHIGNTIQDTSGCILVGKHHMEDTLISSTLAYADMYVKVLDFFNKEEKVFIQINDN